MGNNSRGFRHAQRCDSALTEMVAPPLRAVLWKSVAARAGADRRPRYRALPAASFTWLASAAPRSRPRSGRTRICPVDAIAWLLSIAASLGIVVGSVLLMPAVTALVASFFADRIGEEVERAHYPADPPGKALPLWRAMSEGGKTALLAVHDLSLRRAVLAVRRLRRGDLLPRHRVHSRPRIFRACRHALSAAGGGQEPCASATP